MSTSRRDILRMGMAGLLTGGLVGCGANSDKKVLRIAYVSGPIRAKANVVNRSVIFALFMISPASRKNGSAKSTIESQPTEIRWATIIGDMSVNNTT